MTHEQIVRAKIKALEDMLPVAIAADEGKEVECFHEGEQAWRAAVRPIWNVSNQYRIKPEPLECWSLLINGGRYYGFTEEQKNEHLASGYGSQPVFMREVRE